MKFEFDYTKHQVLLVGIFQELEKIADKKPTVRSLRKILKQFAKPGGGYFTKDQLVYAYRQMAGKSGLKTYSENVVKHLRMKPVRTQSGVTPVTVLTKPFPCPGKCIFCPNDIRMPKSYLSDEPGAQRAERNWFDPYLQTVARLNALWSIGHQIDKVEFIILGGTWSYYPEPYQIWFIKRCFEALNDFGDDREKTMNSCEKIVKKYQKLEMTSDDPVENKQKTKKSEISGQNLDKTYNQVVSELYVGPEMKAGVTQFQQATWLELEKQQVKNETAQHRCVGLVIETRPDNISQQEVIRIRRLGCTKTQIGFQSLNDDVLKKNNRGHDVDATRRAVKLLRLAGFKIHAHWMANLYGSSVEEDKKDYLKLFEDPDFRPDELKIYPCSLISSAELMQYYEDGRWSPYSRQELLDVLEFALLNTPEYCRLTRVIRDIPSTDIVEGNKLTNFRQITEQSLEKKGMGSQDIRAREIRRDKFNPEELELDVVEYETSVTQERFLQFVTPERRIVGFLRLSLPDKQESADNFIEELRGAAMIREVHVYGSVANIGTRGKDKAQHLGLGTRLIEEAKKMALAAGFKRLAVISSVGTREYYRKRGFRDGELYQVANLSNT